MVFLALSIVLCAAAVALIYRSTERCPRRWPAAPCLGGALMLLVLAVLATLRVLGIGAAVLAVLLWLMLGLVLWPIPPAWLRTRKEP
ncbi:MAG: hypothetical protein AB1437_17190 [Pseudomonadota bacterium]